MRIPGFPIAWGSPSGNEFDSLAFLLDFCDALAEFSASACDFPSHVIPDDVPLRVILRNTKTYRKLLVGGALQPSEIRWPLLREEEVQLERNDIPYFFTFPRSQEIYFYGDDSWRIEKAHLPAGTFTHLSHRLQASVATCLDSERLGNVLGSTALFLGRRLLPLGHHEDPTGTLAVTRDKGSIRVRYLDRVFASRLGSPSGIGR
jgi:hypothetical protein